MYTLQRSEFEGIFGVQQSWAVNQCCLVKITNGFCQSVVVAAAVASAAQAPTHTPANSQDQFLTLDQFPYNARILQRDH